MSAGPAADDHRLDHVLREVAAARLVPDDWARVDELLARLESGDGVVDDLQAVLFEAKVRGRFSGGRASASLPPTKQTSVLPIVGVVCGGMLFGVGALLGGGIILVGVAALGLFVFGIAFAGSRVAHRAPDVGSGDEPPAAPPERAPEAIAQRLERLRA